MNSLFRFVYLRALPLVQQPELRSATATDLNELGKQIETTAGSCYRYHLERIWRERSSTPPEVPLEEPAMETLLDERTRTHVRLASWALGTYRVLYPILSRDERRTLQVVRQGFGVQGTDMPRAVSALHHLMVRLRLIFARDRRRARLELAERFERDLGPLFEPQWVSRHGAEVRDVLLIRHCIYAEIFRLERVPQLLSMFCAMDRASFAGLAEFTLEPGLAQTANPQPCRFDFGPADAH
ncbi:hypothetical protein CCYA_CCYA09G2517 [Cyanidiococcus yangmingshanensis]|uniref:Uncharacterized protein n=1 Tax=Cyanidiococcus yangmingshanensis TaxID=2690220 RepID=A0A7J7IJH6_9RHOD|nr:hypothetical protein F1559_000491 [Cyanidiococcus yangmingshanensis]KAK4531660.1 hypothetical protein CCYA_CCYA09G2517 [Cyanidiococcus yangmingshanensis]